ncbi:AraC family transcriptional regulator [Pseudomonas sp. NPDC077186]|uniref:helix-turn-helix transcriptional regulator n=1 Tax=Pseudomonadaceae TaxID=135621 RepID=UPI000D1AC719|nr:MULTISPECIES: helix-turn-helix domain-containing protein [Pseudomonas]MBF8164717.1 helix-turn-helix domain-containing protein [Pseudomonas mendocina]EKN0216423.1 helix-turn-helix domain-containing protein [Pseudomonas aeruginosa]EKT8168147.1 helix-turn-helix domain-containing protein [Pseudomonas aeruginosa]MCV3977812.1 AraC family transcriptional regulator [Pseudomonas aeruginosa]MDG9925714.1 AraC family transcriptional regulator [Pseudomonas sp. GD04045]
MKSSPSTDTVRWVGHAWVGPGIGVFHGRAGHQGWHHHQAHQISVGLDSTVAVETPLGIHSGAAIFIPAGLKHRLSAGRVLSIYVDALSEEARALRGTEEARVIEITPADVAAIIGALRETGHSAVQLKAGVRQALRLPDPPISDPRLTKVIEALRRGQMRREEMAALVHLSPTRFSHWFVEQTGLPLRSYAKWLRLTQALQHLAKGGRLTEAAHEAGFSDSAHFSRTFRTLLGIDPSSALAEVDLQES